MNAAPISHKHTHTNTHTNIYIHTYICICMLYSSDTSFGTRAKECYTKAIVFSIILMALYTTQAAHMLTKAAAVLFS